MLNKLVLGAGILVATHTLPAFAHDVWIEPEETHYRVVYGHANEHEPYDTKNVKRIEAFNAEGKQLAVMKKITDHTVSFSTEGNPALLTFYFDYGYWSKTSKGDVNLSKIDAVNPTSTYQAVKYSKTVLYWSPAATKPVQHHLEITPLTGAQPADGGKLPVVVHWKGKPLAKIDLNRGHGDGKINIRTDSKGEASLPVTQGRQVWTVKHIISLEDDPLSDQYHALADIVFQVE